MLRSFHFVLNMKFVESLVDQDLIFHVERVNTISFDFISPIGL